MESPEVFGSNGMFSLGGGLSNSLLDSATLSTSNESNSAFLGLLREVKTSSGASDPFASELDHLSSLDMDNSLSFNTPNWFNTLHWRAPVPSHTESSNSPTDSDPLTGMTNNTTLVSLTDTDNDPLTGAKFLSSAKATENSLTSQTKRSTEAVQSEGTLSIDGGRDFDVSPAESSSLESNSTFTSSRTAFRASTSVRNANDNSPSNSLVSEGKFGDFNGLEDVQLTINDANGNLETFALTGDGYGEVFKGDNFEQVVFTGNNKTTSVQISAINNIKFGDYIGSSLDVQTSGSITAGNITLKNTNFSSSPGLILRSGLSALQNSASGSSYSITDLGTLPGYSYGSYANGINNSGQVVGASGMSYRLNHAFLYSDGQMTDLGTLPGYSFSSVAFDINDSGQVVGYSRDAWHHAFLYSDGQMTDLGTLPGGGYHSQALGINNAGQVVGDSDNGSDGWHAFLYSDGQMNDLGTLPGGSYSTANDINNSGQVVGYSNSVDGSYHAFLYSNGQMTDLGTLPGYSNSFAESINNSGQIVGTSNSVDGSSHAFLYSNGQMTDLGTLPGYSNSFAESINNSGQVVGASVFSFDDGAHHPFLYSNGTMTDLNSLIPSSTGWTLDDATAINDLGQIVGYGTVGGQQHAFLLDPPTTFTATPQDGITVGNISTRGDSILLRGLKINLTGSSVSSKGGNITLDGPTILNSSTGALAFNSTANSRGGNITFNNTLGGNSAGTQSLSLKAGQGNVTFNKAVGSNAALKDLTVNTAKTVTASEDITSSGDIITSVTQNITTGKLVSNNGAVKLTSKQGAVATQDITSGNNTTIAASQSISTGNILSNSGAVSLTSKFSSITTQDLTTSGNAASNNSGNRGNITLKAVSDITTANLSTHGAGKVSISLQQNTTVANQPSGGVTTGSITAGQVDILSDGGVTAYGNIETNSSDVNITAIRDIVTYNITAQNGATSLISGAGAINAIGEINSDLGLIALANQNITTNKIQSDNDVVILRTSQGAVTVNGEIASYGDVSIDALNDVVAQDITSLDGAIALISHNGTVTATGEITSIEDVTLGAAGDVVAQTITSQLGTVALVSSQGTVTANGDINSGIDVAISAKQNINTGKISSLSGTVLLNTEQGTVTTTGNVTTAGGDVYIASVGDVISHNIISNGGAITIDSSQGSVTTGYLRSNNGNESGGKIYVHVKATGSFLATDSVQINGTNYSIYTGSNRPGWVRIVYGSGVTVAFDIGSATTTNGTVADVSPLPSFKPRPAPTKPGLGGLILLIFEIILDAGPAGTPTSVEVINPITGKPYGNNPKERQLVEQLNPEQRRHLSEWINSRTRAVRLNEQEVFTKGKIDTGSGCFTVELSKHYGDRWNRDVQAFDITHSLYASYITGARGDYFVLPHHGRPALFDGLTKQNGEVVLLEFESVGSLAEVKTGPSYGVVLRKNLPVGNLNRLNSPMDETEQRRYRDMQRQISREAGAAEECGFEYFLCFSNQQAQQAAQVLFGNIVSSIYYIKIPGNIPQILQQRGI